MARKSKKKVGKGSEPTLTAEDARNYLRRFPAQGAVQVAFNLGMVLVGNAIVFWLLLNGELRAAHLIALVVIETVLLIAISWLLQRAVPRADWSEQPKPWREKIPVFAFLLIWLGGAYGITLVVTDGVADFFSLMRSADAWIESRLYLPVLYTLVLALVHAVGDMHHYRRHGGPFLSSVSHDAMARYLTLLLGGIPFVMPFFAVVIGGFKGIEFLVNRARRDLRTSLLGGISMLAVGIGSFQLVGWLIASGVRGWAIGYVFAKLIAESMIVCIPLVMAKVIAEDGAQAAKAAAR